MNKKVLAVGALVTTPLILLLVLNLGRNPSAIKSPLIQKPAPDVRVVNLEGGAALQLSALKGRPVVVNFWATWCVPCVQEHAALSAGAARNRDVSFMGVVYEDTADNARAFLQQRGAAYNSYEDTGGKAAIAFGVYGVPETFFLDAKGVIVDKYVGPLDDFTLSEKLAAVRR